MFQNKTEKSINPLAAKYSIQYNEFIKTKRIDIHCFTV